MAVGTRPFEVVRLGSEDPRLARAVEVEQAAECWQNPHATPYSYAERLVDVRNLDPAEDVVAYAGCLEERVVATAICFLPLLDNTDKANVKLSVEPKLWRRGFGSALLDQVVTDLRAWGRRLVLGGVSYPLDADETYPARSFAVKNGFTLANAEVHRVLWLPLSPARLEALLAECAGHTSDYSFAEFTGALPEPIMPAYCELLNALNTDAPSGAVEYEAGGVTPDDFAARLDVMSEQGRTLYTSVAFDRDGVTVAHSELSLPANDPDNIFQWSTLVRRQDRGHRLGAATKARNLRRGQRRHPGRTSVHTWNAESNTAMIAVNEALGFEAVGYASRYQRSL
ncbi:MAG: GNAT family N-acetyltransferase [Nocardioidaceae bacterium]